MAFMEWREEYSVGVSVFDEEHKKMIAMISALHESMRAGSGETVVRTILDDLIVYTMQHFAHEEEVFLQTGFPAAVMHRMRHETLKKQVQEYSAQAEILVGGALVIDLSRFLHDWLITHIQQEDMHYGPHLNAKGMF